MVRVGQAYSLSAFDLCKHGKNPNQTGYKPVLLKSLLLRQWRLLQIRCNADDARHRRAHSRNGQRRVQPGLQVEVFRINAHGGKASDDAVGPAGNRGSNEAAPPHLNLQAGLHSTLAIAGVSAAMSCIIGVAAYLKQSPLPQDP